MVPNANQRGISLTYGPQEAFMNTWQEIIKVYSMEEGNMVEIDAYRINFHEMPGSSYDFFAWVSTEACAV